GSCRPSHPLPGRHHTPPTWPSVELLPSPALLRPPRHQPRPPRGSSRVPHAPPPLPRRREAPHRRNQAPRASSIPKIATRGSTQELKLFQGPNSTNHESDEMSRWTFL